MTRFLFAGLTSILYLCAAAAHAQQATKTAPVISPLADSLTISADSFTVAEGETLTVTLSVEGLNSEDDSVPVLALATFSGNAKESDIEFDTQDLSCPASGSCELTVEIEIVDDGVVEEDEIFSLSFILASTTGLDVVVTITDPPPVVIFTADSFTVAEGATLTVTARVAVPNPKPGGDVTKQGGEVTGISDINIRYESAEQADIASFDGSPRFCTESESEPCELTYEIVIANDTVVEEDEIFSLIGSYSVSNAQGSFNRLDRFPVARVTITDPGPPIADAGEDKFVPVGDSRVTLGGTGNTGKRPLSYRWDIPALDGEDLDEVLGQRARTMANPSIRIPDFYNTYDVLEFTLVVTDADGNESLPDTVLVTAFRQPTLRLSAASYNVVEGEVLEVTVHVEDPPAVSDGKPIEVVLNGLYSTDTASKNDLVDHSGQLTHRNSQNCPAGQECELKFLIEIAQDGTFDPDETFRINLEDIDETFGLKFGYPREAIVTITDELPVVAFTADSYTVAEGETLTVTATVDGPTTDSDGNGIAVTVGVDLSSGTADKDDFTRGAGQRSCPQTGPCVLTFEFEITDDMLLEDDDETFEVFIAPSDGQVRGSPNTATVTIVPPLPAVFFTADSYTVPEGETLVVTVTLDAPSTGTAWIVDLAGTFNVASAEGIASAEDITRDLDGNNFAFLAGTQSCLTGQCELTFEVVEIAKDRLVEGDETFRLIAALRGDTGQVKDDSATVTIKDGPVADAGDRQVVFWGETVTLDGTRSGDGLSHKWRVVHGDVTLNDSTAEQPTFAAPDQDIELIFGLMVTGEDENESLEDTVVVRVIQSSRISFSSTSYTVAEGETLVVPVIVDSPPPGKLADAVKARINHVEGVSTQDISQFPNTDETCPLNELCELSFEIDILHDQVIEDDEYFTIELAGSNADVIEPYIATVTITDTPPLPVARPGVVGRSGANLVVGGGEIITLDGTRSFSLDPDDPKLTYEWTVVEGDVTLDNHTASRPTFTAPSGDNQRLVFELVVTDANGYESTPATLPISVVQTPLLRLSADSYTVAEGETLTVTVNGSGLISPYNSRVLPGTDGATAVLGQDYGVPHSTSGPVISNREECNPCTETFEIVIQRDTEPEEDETFGIVLYLGTPSQVPVGVATVTITDVPPPVAKPRLAGQGDKVNAGALATLDGTGSYDPQGDELTGYAWSVVSGGVTLSDNTAKQPTFRAPDSNTELTFQLVVTDENNHESLPSTVVIRVVKTPEIALASRSYTVAEGETLVVKAHLYGHLSSEKTFTVERSDDGTGLTDDDFVVLESGQAFGIGGIQTVGPSDCPEDEAGPCVLRFTAEIANDTETEFSEIFNIGLGVPLDIDIGQPNMALVTITDNRPPVANAGFDIKTAPSGSVVELRGYGTDPDNDDIVGYRWERVGGTGDDTVRLNDPNAQRPTFTAETIRAGGTPKTHKFSLIVTDEHQRESTTAALVEVTVLPVPFRLVASPQTISLDLEETKSFFYTAEPAPTPEYPLVIGPLDNLGPFEVVDDRNFKYFGFTSDIDASTGTASTGTSEVIITDAQFEVRVTRGTGGVPDGNYELIPIRPERYILQPPTVVALNPRPTADAGITQNVPEGTTVTLSGSGSDPENDDITGYIWKAPDDVTLTLTPQTQSQPTFIAPVQLVEDLVLTITLEVTDENDRKSHAATVEIKVEAGLNDPPVLQEIDLQIVDEGDEVTLSVSASDPEGETLTYAWEQLDDTGTVELSPSDSDPVDPAVATFIAPENFAEDIEMVFQVVVADARTESSSTTATVMVRADNDPPNVTVGIDQVVDEGDEVTLSVVSASDPEDETLSYEWRRLDDGPAVTLTLSGEEDDPEATYTAPAQLEEDLEMRFRLVVTDASTNESADTDESTVAVTVRAALRADAGVDQEVDEGDTVTLAGSSTGTASATRTHLWEAPGGVTLSEPSSPSATFDAPVQLVEDLELTLKLTVTDTRGGSVEDTVVITVRAGVNDPPDVPEVADQTVDEGEVVTLELPEQASDPEGETLRHQWTAVGDAASAVTLSGAATETATFTAPVQLAAGLDLEFQLSVKDEREAETLRLVTVTVTAGDNDPPDVPELADQTVDEGEVVTLELPEQASDPEGETLRHQWTAVGDAASAVTLSGAATETATFTAPENLVENLELEFQLSVKDAREAETLRSVTVTVTAGDNDPPVVPELADQTVDEGEVVTLELPERASDPEGETLSHLWTAVNEASRAVTLSGASTETASFTAPVQLAADLELEFQLSVKDARDAETLRSVTVTVTAGDNDPPVVPELADQTVDEGEVVTLELPERASDPEGETLSHLWTAVGDAASAVTLSGAGTETATFTAPVQLAAGLELEFQLSVKDLRDAETLRLVTVTVTAGDNDPPDVPELSDQTVDEGEVVTLELPERASDPEGETLRHLWTAVGDAASAVTLSGAATETATFTAPENLVENEVLEFQLSVKDEREAETLRSVTVTVTAGDNDPPVVPELTDQTVDEGEVVTLELPEQASDPEGETLRHQWTALNDAARAVTLSGAATETATFTAPENLVENEVLEFQLSVKDEREAETLRSVTVTVRAGDNDPPVVPELTDQTVDEGEVVTLELPEQASDLEGETLRHQWTALNDAARAVTLSGAATETATFTAPENLVENEVLEFQLSVKDEREAETLRSVTVTVTAGDNDPPDVPELVDQTVDEGEVVTLELPEQASDPEGETLRHQWTALNDAARAVTLSGAATETATFTAPENLVENEVLEFQLSVKDEREAETLRLVTVTVTAGDNDPPDVPELVDQTVDEGEVVTLELPEQASDPEGETLKHQWTAVGDAASAVTLSGAATETATFTAPVQLAAGLELEFQLSVKDAREAETLRSVTVTVTAGDNDPPVVPELSDQTVDEGEVVTLELPERASDPEGETLRHLWTAVNEAARAVTLSGAATETATFTAPVQLAAGLELEFQLSVKDAREAETLRSVTVTVTAGDNDPPVVPELSDQTVDEGEVVTLELPEQASDPEGETLRHLWTAVNEAARAVTLSGAATETATFTAPVQLAAGLELEFQLSVKDERDAETLRLVTVMVRAGVNDPPVIDGVTATPPAVIEGETSELVVTARDPEGVKLTYQWRTPDAGSLSDLASPTPIFTAPTQLRQGGMHVFLTVTVSDGESTPSVDTVLVAVAAGVNDPPVIDGITATPPNVGEGGTSALAVTAMDPEGVELSYQWTAPTVGTLSGVTLRTPTFTAPTQLVADQDVILTVAVSDGESTPSQGTVVVAVAAGVNDPPVVPELTDQTVDEGEVVTLELPERASDPEGETLRHLWTAVGDAASTVTLSGSATETATFTAPEKLVENKVLEFQLSVKDERDVETLRSVMVTVRADNGAPTAVVAPVEPVVEGQLVTLDGSGSTDPEDEVLTYKWTPVGDRVVNLDTTVPERPTFIAPNRIVSDTMVEFELVVMDESDNPSLPVTVTIMVRGVNDPPTAVAGVDQRVAEGARVVLAGQGRDPEREDIFYIWTPLDEVAPAVDNTSAKPSEFVFDAPRDLVDDEVLSFELRVRDYSGALSEPDMVLVTVLADNGAPTAVVKPVAPVAEGELVTLDGSESSDPEDETLTYDWTPPDGVFMDETVPERPTFTAPGDLAADKIMSFALVVSDASGNLSAPDMVVVTVLADVSPVASDDLTVSGDVRVRTNALESGVGMLASEVGWSAVRAVRQRSGQGMPQNTLRLGASTTTNDGDALSTFATNSGLDSQNPGWTISGPDFGTTGAAQEYASVSDALYALEASQLLGQNEDGSRFAGVWLKGEENSFKDRSGRGEREGDLKALHGGLDVRLSPQVLAGLAGALYEGGFDYRDRNNLSGNAEFELASLYPYVNWDQGDTSVWLALGGGSGEVKVTEGDLERASDVNHSLAAIGLAQHFEPSEEIDMALRLEGLYSSLEVADSISGGDLDYYGFESSVWRIRGQGEIGWTFIEREGLHLRPYVRIGALLEDGDVPGLYGIEHELGVDLDMGGFHLQAEGRYHHLEEGRRAHGYSLSADYDNDDDGRGLLFALRALQGGGRSFDPFNARDLLSGSRSSNGRQTEAELGYGFWLGRHGLLKPYLARRLATGRSSMTFGLDYKVRALRMGLAFEQNRPDAAQSAGQSEEDRFTITAELEF